MRYASQTTVSTERSKAEIESVLNRYGATQFAYGWSGVKAILGFEYNNKLIRFELDFSGIEDDIETPTGRIPKNKTKAMEQAVRQKWRALVLAIKAKLELVESGIATFEEEFLANIVLPDGRLLKDLAIPQIEEAYETKKMPLLLEGFNNGKSS